MIKAATPYAETPRNTKGRFVEKDATFGVKMFPARRNRKQRYLMHYFMKEYQLPMEQQAAKGVDEEYWMGTTRTAWLVYGNISEDDTILQVNNNGTVRLTVNSVTDT
jgi:hypothetical protein